MIATKSVKRKEYQYLNVSINSKLVRKCNLGAPSHYPPIYRIIVLGIPNLASPLLSVAIKDNFCFIPNAW
jgi:hypothetical protein